MERLEAEHHVGNGVGAFDLEEEFEVESNCSEVGDDGVGCLTRWWRGHVYTPFRGGAEMELDSIMDESNLDDREDSELASIVPRRRRPFYTKKIFWVPCCVVCVIIIYTVICIALMAAAGRGIDIEYLGSAQMNLTCNGVQLGSGRFRFTRDSTAAVTLFMRNAKFSFYNGNGRGGSASVSWGFMGSDEKLTPTSADEIVISGPIGVGDMGEIQKFLSGYLNWRLVNATRPDVYLTAQGDIGSKFFPFWVPTTVHTMIHAPHTTTEFALNRILADFKQDSLSAILNLTEDGFHAWNPGVPMTFVVTDPSDPSALAILNLTTHTTASYAKSLFVSSENGGILGDAVRDTNKTLTIKGIPGECLPQKIIGGVSFNLSTSRFHQNATNGTETALLHVNSGSLHDTKVSVNLSVVSSGMRIPIEAGGEGMRFYGAPDTSPNPPKYFSFTGPPTPQDSENFTATIELGYAACGLLDPLLNNMSTPRVCLKGDGGWLSDFLSSYKPCTVETAGKGYGLWQVVVEPQKYIKNALQVTTRRLKEVRENAAEVELRQTWPGGGPVVVGVNPLRVVSGGVPNITIGEVTGAAGGVFGFSVRSEPSQLDPAFWDMVTSVEVTPAQPLPSIVTGAKADLPFTVTIAALSFTSCTLTTPQWAGLLHPSPGLATNPYPIAFTLLPGQYQGYALNTSSQIAMQRFTPTYDFVNTTLPFTKAGGGPETPVTLLPSCEAAAPLPQQYQGQDYDCICGVLDDPTQCGLTWGTLPEDVCADIKLRPDSEVTLFQTCPSECTWCQLVPPDLAALPNVTLT